MCLELIFQRELRLDAGVSLSTVPGPEWCFSGFFKLLFEGGNLFPVAAPLEFEFFNRFLMFAFEAGTQSCGFVEFLLQIFTQLRCGLLASGFLGLRNRLAQLLDAKIQALTLGSKF